MQDARWLDNWKGLIAQLAEQPAILELGCGEGRDTRWLLQQGFTDVTATELSRAAIAQCAHSAPAARLICHDLRAPLPFSDTRFDAVIASLCLHYFAWDKTLEIVSEIRRCLRPGGLLLCRLNSTRDVHHGATGHPKIAHHYYEVEGNPKRFFDQTEVEALFAEGWVRLSSREMCIDRYEMPKVAWEAILRKS